MNEKNAREEHLPLYKPQWNTFKIVTDVFLCGPPEKGPNGEKFEGAFPSGFLKKIKLAFKNYYPGPIETRTQVLHVCAGRVPKSEGMTLDIDKKYDPVYLCNAEIMILPNGTRVPPDKFSWSISDTPYNIDAAKKYYDKPMINRSKVLQQMNRVTKVGGFIGILDQITTNSPPRNLKVVARIGVTSVPNLDMRYFTVLKKLGPTVDQLRAKDSERLEEWF